MPKSERHREANARRVVVAGEWVAPGRLHGSPSTYSNHGCRCESCRAAHAKMIADARVKRHALTEENGGVAPTETHGSATYANWRCRCEVCVTAWNREGRRRRSAKAA